MKNRRSFILQSSCALGSFFFNHINVPDIPSSKRISDLFNIKHVKLNTSVDIVKMVEFYHKKIGFKLLFQDQYNCSFLTGKSILSFEFVNGNSSEPFYHFAFNITENKIQHAEEWQSKICPLIEPPDALKVPAIENDYIVNLKHWNAHSIFFYDPAGNIVEYIARHNLTNSGIGYFGIDDIHCLSEVGFVVDDVLQNARKISKHLNFGYYGDASEDFAAVGNENGLLLFFKKETRAVFDLGRKRSVYHTELVMNTNLKKDIQIGNYPYHICS